GAEDTPRRAGRRQGQLARQRRLCPRRHPGHCTKVATMTSPQNPPIGYTSVTPFLVVAGAAPAIEFYAAVFGASEVSRNELPDGTIPRAELQFPHGRSQLGDPAPSMGLVAPDGSNDVDHSYVLYCDDVDAVWQAAVAAGATAFEEPST